jgi:hypothetical protein
MATRGKEINASILMDGREIRKVKYAGTAFSFVFTRPGIQKLEVAYQDGAALRRVSANEFVGEYIGGKFDTPEMEAEKDGRVHCHTYRIEDTNADALHALAHRLGYKKSRGRNAASHKGNTSALLRALAVAYLASPEETLTRLQQVLSKVTSA